MDSLYVMINEVHPDMFAFLSKEAFEDKLDQARLLVRDGMTVREFFKVIAPLVAALGDGHTLVYFPYTLWDSKTLLIPFEAEVGYADSSVFVIRDYSDPENAIPGRSYGHIFHAAKKADAKKQQRAAGDYTLIENWSMRRCIDVSMFGYYFLNFASDSALKNGLLSYHPRL